MTPLHAAALAYARAGIPVFAVREGGKRPLPYSKGFHDATTDENTINAWWEHNPRYNLAIEPEQAGWCVVDLDGDEGMEAWGALCIAHGISVHQERLQTRVIKTPGGGRHVYFEGSLPPTARKLGAGIDTRGHGSYVLVPPSIVDGKPYEVLTDHDIAPLPEWIETACTTVAERKTAEGDFDLDSPERITDARRRIATELKWNGTPYIGGGSDTRAYKLTARLREIGLSDETIGDMLEALWTPANFDREWIDEKVANAEKFAQNERGSVHVRIAGETYNSLLTYVSPSSRTEPGLSSAANRIAEQPSLSQSAIGSTISEQISTTSSDGSTQPLKAFAQSLATIQHEPSEPVEWVWRDRLLAGKANLYTGDAGAGKTTLAENIAVAVACEVPDLLGAKIKPMPVLLLVGEDDKSQVRDNLVKIAAGLDVLDHPGFGRIFVRSVLTDDPEGGHMLARFVEGELEYLPFMHELAQFICDIGEPCLIVIDPLAEFVAFDNIDPVQCRAVAQGFCRLLSQFGAGHNTVLVNDHPSKASIASGHHYAGSVQMKAAFALVATILPGEWSGVIVRQRELTFSVLKARYAAETQTRFYRTSVSPLFLLNGAPGMTREDGMRRVYEHIRERLERGLLTSREANRGDYPRTMVAHDLDMSEADVKAAMTAILDKQWFVYRNGAGSGSSYVAAHFDRGPVTPLPTEGAQAY